MNNELIKAHNDVVKPNDIVIWGGDIGFGSIKHLNFFLNRCNGYKIHIVGNHDMTRKGRLFLLDVDERHPCMLINVSIDQRELQLLITHYPLSTVPDNCISIHGHTHTKNVDPWNINISVEQTGYAPIHLNSVIQQTKQYFNIT